MKRYRICLCQVNNFFGKMHVVHLYQFRPILDSSKNYKRSQQVLDPPCSGGVLFRQGNEVLHRNFFFTGKQEFKATPIKKIQRRRLFPFKIGKIEHCAVVLQVSHRFCFPAIYVRFVISIRSYRPHKIFAVVFYT